MAAKIKREEMVRIMWQLPMLKITEKINISFQAYEKSRRKDPDNIYTMACKFTLDAMVKKGLLENDGQKQVGRITFEPPLIGEPRMEITITT